MKDWDIQVVLRDPHSIESQAELARQGLRTVHASSIGGALHQIETWLEATPDAELFLSVRTAEGPWSQIATRRWRVAAYFLLTHYEQAFVAAGAAAPANDNKTSPVRGESGMVSTTADTQPLPRRSGGQGD